MSQSVTIRSLPDNVLLDIFEFHQVIINESKDEHPCDWKTLVHVCQRWRYLVLESPIRLNLQLFCTEKTPVEKLLHVWPASLPISIHSSSNYGWWSSEYLRDGFGNILATLKHCDRIRQIHITNRVHTRWKKIVTAMQGSFPVLRSLFLHSLDRGERIHICGTLPDTFLNGSAPCLQHLTLRAIAFPSLPRFLSSTSDLTTLHLVNIPDSGYISPVTMATSLSALPKLESIYINFKSPPPFGPYPQRSDRPVPPPTRFVLPALTELQFQGMSEYLEVLTARFDAPLLAHFDITTYHQPELVLDIPQTIRFFDHLEWPRPSSVALHFDPYSNATINVYSDTMPHSFCPRSWSIMGKWFDWQVSAVAHIFSQILPFRSSVESLIIQCPDFRPHANISDLIQQDQMDSTLGPELLHSFTSVRSLEISAPIESFIAAALQGLTESSATEVLPSLRSLSIVGKMSDETVQQGIRSFVAARQHSPHPVIISCREVDWSR
jgi:hypothetical protein